MMNDAEFLRVLREAYEPFLSTLGFIMERPSISGRLYRVNFVGQKKIVVVSYEPGDNALFLFVLDKNYNGLADIDDREKTPTISDLNKRYMSLVSEEEYSANDFLFENVVANSREEKMLLKWAKELRLVLPRYLSDC